MTVPVHGVGSGTPSEITIDLATMEELRSLGEAVGVDLLSELVELFVEDTERLLVQLRHAAGAGDVVAVGQIAHNIKGGGGQLGARQLVSSCTRLERSASSGLSAARPDLAEVERDYLSFRAALTLHAPPAPSHAQGDS
jgi:HPt (histidine-containing phosphotransfer) domain-containing protein